MSAPAYTYFIEGVEVHPGGTWTISHLREEGQIFHRRIFSGELTFGNAPYNRQGTDDYEYITSFSGCQQLGFEIKCEGDTFWEGYFGYPLDWTFDKDACLAKSIPNVLDEYTCIMKWYDKEELWTPLTGGHTINLYERVEPVDLLEKIGLAYHLKDTLLYILDRMHFVNWNGADCITDAADIVSTFLWNDNWPDGTAYANNNYATGATNYLSPANDYDLFLIRTCRLINDLGGTVDIDNYNISINKIMTLLRDKLQVYWYIDTNGKLRLEHISYFEPGFAWEAHTDVRQYGADLTSIANKDKTWAFGLNKISFDKDRFYYVENFYENNTVNDDFVGHPIYYDEDCAWDFPHVNERDYSVDVTTDIDAVYDNPDDMDSAGITLLWAREEDLVVDNDDINNWAAHTYGTFNHAGIVIVQAQDGAGGGDATSNTFANVSNGDMYSIWINNLVNAGGELPWIDIVDGVGASITGGAQHCAAGTNVYTFTIAGVPPATAAYVQVYNTVACNWSADDFVIDEYVLEWVLQWEIGQVSAAWFWNNHLSWANVHNTYWRHDRVHLTGDMNNTPDNFLSTSRKMRQENVKWIKGSDCCANALNAFDVIKTDQGWGVVESADETQTTINATLLFDENAI